MRVNLLRWPVLALRSRAELLGEDRAADLALA
jgi:hypothetical protein